MLLIADWVIHAHDEERETRSPYKELRKQVLSHHKEMGMAEEFQYSEEFDDYFESRDYEDRAPQMRLIEEHDEQTFWSTLADQLARRGLAAKEMLSTKGSDNDEERVMRLFESSERYEEEFAEHGLDNLRIVGKDGSVGALSESCGGRRSAAACEGCRLVTGSTSAGRCSRAACLPRWACRPPITWKRSGGGSPLLGLPDPSPHPLSSAFRPPTVG
jgi:hypothetical protein